MFEGRSWASPFLNFLISSGHLLLSTTATHPYSHTLDHFITCGFSTSKHKFKHTTLWTPLSSFYLGCSTKTFSPLAFQLSPSSAVSFFPRPSILLLRRPGRQSLLHTPLLMPSRCTHPDEAQYPSSLHLHWEQVGITVNSSTPTLNEPWHRLPFPLLCFSHHLTVPPSTAMISNILHPPHTSSPLLSLSLSTDSPASYFIKKNRSCEGGSPPSHTTIHKLACLRTCSGLLPSHTIEDLVLPLDKASPAISALDSISSCILKSLANISYPISRLSHFSLICLTSLSPRDPSQWFLRMLRSLPLRYSLITHLPPTLSLSLPLHSQSYPGMLFMLNSLHFFVSYSLFSQSQSGFYLCSITLPTLTWDTNELCVPKTHFVLFFF